MEVAMSGSARVLLIDDAPRLSEEIGPALATLGCEARTAALSSSLESKTLRRTDWSVMVLDPHGTQPHLDQVLARLEELSKQRVPTIVWGLPPKSGTPMNPLIECVPSEASLSEVVARLETINRYAPLVRHLEGELDKMQRVGNQLNRYFHDLDQEMRLAGRLQRDFLPAKLPQIPPLNFAAIYRPATWVSGDMYDVFRIDETHVGMFLIDAMGHGIAAGLLTMFLRQALVAKRINGKSYEIVSPAEAVAALNDTLVGQELPNCQFVTGVYAIIDTQRLELRVARGGHPYPLLIGCDGTIRELPAPGGLLGIPGLPNDFAEQRVHLSPGDKLLLYTDGLLDDLIDPVQSEPDQPVYTEALQRWAPLSLRKLIEAMEAHFDSSEGSLNPEDDMTVIGLEISPDRGDC